MQSAKDSINFYMGLVRVMKFKKKVLTENWNVVLVCIARSFALFALPALLLLLLETKAAVRNSTVSSPDEAVETSAGTSRPPVVHEPDHRRRQ